MREVISTATKGRGIDALLIPGGFGARGSEGKIAAVHFAREEQIPFFGICLGLQMAVIEYARHKAGIAKATSTEFNPESDQAVIHIMESQRKVERLGGSMRLGAYPCVLKKCSLTRKVYGQNEISERHRHRFEVNNSYREKLEQAGMVFSGVSPDGQLVEIIELAGHPWFIGVQFHPEFKSTPRTPHLCLKPLLRRRLSTDLLGLRLQSRCLQSQKKKQNRMASSQSRSTHHLTVASVKVINK